MREAKDNVLSSYRNSLVDVNDKHARQEVPGQGLDMCGDLVNAGLDFGQEGSHVLVIKGESAGEESIEDDTTAPNVSCVSLVFHTFDDLGTGVVRTTAAGFELEGGRCKGGHAPICDFDQGGAEGMYQDIFWLEVAVNDGKRVGIVETIDDLLEEREGVEGRETTAVNEEIEELAAFDVFEYKIELVLAFEDVVYAEYVGVVHEFHHDDLPVDSKTLFL